MLIASMTVMAALLGMHAGQAAQDDGMYVNDKPERTIEAIDAAYATIPPVQFAPEKGRWRNLAGVRRKLLKGGPLTIVNLGDSIVNDAWRSGWGLLLQRRYPKCAITSWIVVRGSTGCWWYRDNGRVERYVTAKAPDLVVIGGISQRDDIDSIREVIRQIRAGCKADILLMTGPFGTVDPREASWQPDIDPKGADYRAKLKALAAELRTGFLDLAGAWGVYIRQSGKELDWFKRDVVHANERGEQILGRIIERFLDVSR